MTVPLNDVARRWQPLHFPRPAGRLIVMKRPFLITILIVHSLAVYLLGLLLFITKWFPYGQPVIRMREWLYRLF